MESEESAGPKVKPRSLFISPVINIGAGLAQMLERSAGTISGSGSSVD